MPRTRRRATAGKPSRGSCSSEGGLKIREGKTRTGNEYVDFETSKGQHFIAQQGGGNFWFVYHLTRPIDEDHRRVYRRLRDRAVDLARARAEAEEAA